MPSPSRGGASRELVVLRSQVKSREYRALARASLWAWCVSQVQHRARWGDSALLPPGPPGINGAFHGEESRGPAIRRFLEGRGCVRGTSGPRPTWVLSKPSGGLVGPVPPQDPRAHHDPPGDSPLQAIGWYSQQPCCRVDLGPAGHSSHLLRLALDRGGREQGELCLCLPQGRGQAWLCLISCPATQR